MGFQPSEPLRILHCLPGLSGGVGRQRCLLARDLPRATFAQRVACYRGDATMVSEALSQDVPVEMLPGPCRFYNARAAMALARLARHWRPTLVHGAVLEGNALASWVGWSQQVPVVLEEATTTVENRSKIVRLFVRVLNRQARCVVAVSQRVASALRAQGIPGAKIRVIGNGVEDPGIPDLASSARARQQLDIPPGSFVVGSVGRLHEQVKRLSDILDAVCLLPEGLRQRTYVVFVGDGPDKERLQSHANRVGLGSRLRLTGARDDHHVFYGLLDVFVLSSAVEAAPLALREAMFAERACIATRAGDAPDIIVNDVSGSLVDSHHPEQIADILGQWLPNQSQRAAIGKAARRVALRRFLLADYVKQISDLYTSICNGERPGPQNS